MKICEILLFLEGEGIPFAFSGDAGAAVEGFSSLARYKPGSFTWIKGQGNIPEGFGLSQIALAFVSEDVDAGAAPNIIRTAQSKRAFFSSIEHFYAREEARPAVGQSTYISPEVKLGKDVRIGHNCTLDGDITIGDGTVIWNNVVIVGRVHIGRDCDIHSGAVIGHDGYAYTEDSAHKKTMVRHFGGVDIGDRVLIGANVCISRGTIDDTVLESGAKVDALGHIAHNCWIGEDAAMAAPCRANGSVHIGKNSYLAGAIVRNQCIIGEDAFVGLGAVVVKDVPPGETVAGNPAKPFLKRPASAQNIIRECGPPSTLPDGEPHRGISSS
ncbi:UDP-3-O-(3-hydroxymyristoyl)glucosamine N-acyltransferase [uncultured Oscillibacter sp.]|uniref:UDP-3-O-(3-hydroxymyristoyl)glucosamine N-acyltransferase n=1 Tax=uncultured Oscillibacter sp. TaxID=876091 RepID=UPI00260EBD22|nr:UDP-3-O-(3-hydroxymyristoyl)glucosamine N-acyltransferase [uncultured Oscillibacter sp.]